MKIAILGTGPMAIELALFFYKQEAMVKMIGTSHPGGKLRRLVSSFGQTELNAELEWTSAFGREHLGLASEPKTLGQLWENYYLPLANFLASERVFIPREVLRVQKQFLHRDEAIEGRSRLHDLFRVVYGLNPTGLVEEQIKENPELAEKIGEDILESLKHSVESFEDFDIVIDARGPYQESFRLGAGDDYALNEKAIADTGLIHYGYDFLEELEKGSFDKSKTLTLVGDGEVSALAVVALEKWLAGGKDNFIQIVTHKDSAYEEYLASNSVDQGVKGELRRIISEYMKSWRSDCEQVEKDIQAWRELAAHEKVKVPCPEFPIPKIQLYEGYTVTSVDKLTDREQVFLTLELPQWKNPSGDKRELITLSADYILGVSGYEGVLLSKGLDKSEPGFITVNWSDRKNHLSEVQKASDEVKDQIFKFFSRAED